jgi:hypothetical protein
MLLGIAMLCSCSDANNKNVSVKLTKEEFKAHYRITNTDSVILYKGECTSDVIIPEKVICDNVEYTVTSIGRYAFENCTRLTSVIIPNGVTNIETFAFYGCTGLTSIIIPSSVTNIGTTAFSGCTGLTSVDIPSSVVSIGGCAFSGCTGLTSIIIPSSVTSIEEYAFENCTRLTSVIIPNGVTSIGESAFKRCTGLSSITIPNSVTSIKNEAFSGCTGLTSVVIPNSVTSISATVFESCGNLTPESAKRIGEIAVEVVMKHPQSVRAVSGYLDGSPSLRWKWKTTFSAKGNKAGFELEYGTYTIKNGGKTWEPSHDIASGKVTVEKGKSGSVTKSFIGEVFRGGVFERRWHGKDEYGNRISLTEKVKLE